MVKKIVIFVIALISCSFAENGDTLKYTLNDTIVVSASRMPTSIVSVNRTFDMVTSAEIGANPISDTDDILKFTYAEVNERRSGNVQADLSLRGSTYNQIRVLWDDIDISDSQTGHFNANIPAPYWAVQRVEVLSGGHSSLHGPGAFGGIVNFIPVSGNDGNIALYIKRGSFNTQQRGFSFEGKYKNFTFGEYYERSSSDGHIPQAYYDVINSYTYLTVSCKNSYHKAGFGYQFKKFGATDFYAPFDSYEKNKTGLFYIKNSFSLSAKYKLTANLFYRTHNDDFILMRQLPSIYENEHFTKKFGGEMYLYRFLSSAISMVSGISYIRENINSSGIRSGASISALGKHYRINKNISTELRYVKKKFLFNAGYRLDYNTFYHYVNSYSVDGGYFITGKSKIRASYSSSYRAPTFTEMYYEDGTSFGNENLKTERSENYELGIDIFEQNSGFHLTGYRMFQYNLIDWLRTTDEEGNYIFLAENFNKAINSGVEATISQRMGDFNFKAVYNYLHKDNLLKENKYSLFYSKYHIKINTSYRFPVGIILSMAFSYRERVEADNITLADVKAVYEVALKNSLELTAEINNIFNKKYENIPGVQMPERRYWLGIKYRYARNSGEN